MKLSRPLTASLGTVLLLSALPALAPPAAAAARPDLVVSKVALDRAKVTAGQAVTVTATTVNRGKGKAKASKTRFLLSTDTKRSKADPVLGTRKVAKLKKGAKKKVSATLTVPEGTKARSWYVLACADATKAVRESKEGNNCRATGTRLTVQAPATDPEITFPMDPDPLTVGSELQTEHAVTKTVPFYEPTTLETTADDGTTYSLTIPADALLSNEQVTITPVASVDGMPLSGGLVAGLQIEPHGLQLFEPAELTITSPEPGPVGQQTAFLFHEDGEDFHLYPMSGPEPGDDAGVVRMHLMHFSTPGVGLGTNADRAEAAAQVPSRTQAQVEAAVSELLRGERQSQLNGNPPSPETTQQVAEIMNQYFDQSVRQQMIAAETDETIAHQAIALGLAWSRQMLLAGDEDNPRHDEIMERVDTILHNVMVQSWADCLDHDISATLDLFRVARAAALFGFAWQQEAIDKALGCGRFEVRFDSQLTSHSSWSGNLQNGSSDGSWHTEATVDTQMLEPNNVGPWTWKSMSYSMQNTITDPDSTCHMSDAGVSTTSGQLRATATPILGSLNVHEGVIPPQPVPVLISVSTGTAPTYTYNHTTCDGSTTPQTEAKWTSYFETFTTDPGQQAADFVDSHTITRDEGPPDSHTTEDTTVEVWHEPEV